MNFMHVLVASTAAFLIIGSGSAKAGQTIKDVGAIACVNDKWDVKSLKKGTSWSTTLADASSYPTILPYQSPPQTA